jgi:glucose/arabinose dehydrogenase
VPADARGLRSIVRVKRRPRGALRSVVALAFAAAVACRAGGGQPEPLVSEAPETVQVSLQRVATVEQPLAIAIRTGDPSLFVAEKTGRVVAIRDGHVVGRPVLDLSDAVSLGGEQGLLGLAFTPDGRHLYVNYTDVNGDTRIVGYAMRGARAVVSSRRQVLVVDQPYENHNGGDLVFGPDGDLYVGLGDGGSGGDPHGNGQSLGTLLGKMLRIEPTPTGPKPYVVPGDNPFIADTGARPEIWAYGLRNPWRYSFDPETGDLWIADVGQSAWEEVDRVPGGSPGGENFGWNLLEGLHRYAGAAPANAEPPVYEYSHATGGCVVIGGDVYRGSTIPALDGWYLFADFCLGTLQAIRVQPGGSVEHLDLGASLPDISSFGADAAGELYVTSLDGGVYRITRG